MTGRVCLALIVLVLALVAPAWSADDADFTREEPVPKHALLIGVSDYRHADKIHNAVNDAKVVAGVLKPLGFAVTVVADPDTDRGALLDAIEAFAATIQSGDVALVFFAGHGIQYQGVNYIVPRDAKNTTPERMGVDNIAVDYVLRTLERLQVGIGLVVLDACRANPFLGARGAAPSTGLAQTVAPAGVLIAFATAPGRVAWSGDQNSANSLYSRHLAARLADQGLRLETMFKKVRADVLADSGQVQQPWENSALLGEFWFNPGPPDIDLTRQLWLDTLDSGDYELIVEYLRLYPASPYARGARRWIAVYKKGHRLATDLPRGWLEGTLYTPRVTYTDQAEFGGGMARAKTGLTLYRDPSFGAAAVATVAAGDDVRVLSRPDPSAGWTRVNVSGNYTGYVAGVQAVSKPARTPRWYPIAYVGDEWQLSDERFREVAAFVGPLSRVAEITIHAGGPHDPSLAKTRQVAFARAVDLQRRLRKIGIGSEKLRIALPGQQVQNNRNGVVLEVDPIP